jgi:hypothetical protein
MNTNTQNIKKIGPEKLIVIASMITGLIMLIMFCLFTKIYNEKHKMFESPDQIDATQILQKAKHNTIAVNDNYHVRVPVTMYFENDTGIHIVCNVDVDKNVAYGTIEVEFGTYSEIYYDKNIEFYRIIENGQITTYMSIDGENWLRKNGFVFNDNHVLFDLKAFIEKIDVEKVSGFYDSDDYIYATTRTIQEQGIFVDEIGLMYDECDYWDFYNLNLYSESCQPMSILHGLGLEVNENKMCDYFAQTNDFILTKICDADINMTLAYNFDKYGDVEINTPSDLSSAEQTNDFSELFTDLFNLIDEYVPESKWR